MKKYLISILFLLILNILYSPLSSQNIQRPDSVKIAYKQLVKATQALIELRNLKKEKGYWQERVRTKDVVIQYYEREFPKYRQLDSINTVLIKNKDREIEIKDNTISELKTNLRLNKAKNIGLGVALPIGIGLSFTAGFYIAKELLK